MNHKENTLDYKEFIIQSALNFLCINFHFLFYFRTQENKQNVHLVHTPNKFHDYQQLPWHAKKLKQKTVYLKYYWVIQLNEKEKKEWQSQSSVSIV